MPYPLRELEIVPENIPLDIRYEDDDLIIVNVKDYIKNPKPNGYRSLHLVVEIPVFYGGSYGEDLKDVAAHAGLTEEEVIKLHSSVDYNIYMLGFLPGFPYLGGLDPKLFTPRLDNPRTKIPEGSVGIGGEQTGIYPLESPGGWRLIGRTPLKLYDPDREQPFLYQAGDYIRFVPITAEEYEAYL